MTAPGDFTAGDVLTAADMNALPAGVLAYAERTTNLSVTSSFQTIASVTFTLPSTRRVLFIAFAPMLYQASGAGTLIDFDIARSGTSYQYTSVSLETTSERKSVPTVYQVALGAGSYTYDWRVKTFSGTATILGQSGGAPRINTIIVLDVGN